MRIWRANLVFTSQPQRFDCIERGYLVEEEGIIRYVGAQLPSRWQELPVEDLGEALMIPGFVDVHVHAPQLPNQGVGLDEELLPWLEKHTFPMESRFSDLEFAEKCYRRFARELIRQGTTRVVVFGTIHQEATLLLAQVLREAGLGAYVGRVNMDRNCPEELREDTRRSLEQTEEFLWRCRDPRGMVKPILTPRFVPSTTPQLMEGLGRLAQRYQVPVQSHLCENRSEVEWVASLHPEIPTFAQVYERYGLMPEGRTIMAHCIYLKPEEQRLLAEKKVLVAHCPQSNTDLASGMMPLRRWLNQGLRVGLGSDVAGGHSLSMMRQLVDAVGISKLRWVEAPEERFLTLSEAFYLATKGGGAWFGRVGSLEEGYAMDALVLREQEEPLVKRSPMERLEQLLYTGDDRNIERRIIAGREVQENFEKI
ncbi:MAG: guanine deaminase [Eubacteriales bacterium]|jgi:guanine deaminase